MPKPITNYSFVTWLEDIANLPKEIKQRTAAVYFDAKKREYRVVFIGAPGGNPNATPDTAYISAFLEGEETFHDIKGVNLQVDIYDFIRNPTGSTLKILDSAKTQITNLDDIGSERRSENVELLVRGNVNKNGKKITDPDNWFLGRLEDIGLPLSDMDSVVPKDARGNRTSAIQLLKPATAGGDDYEDIKVVEEGEGKGKSYKAYRDLAGSLVGLSGYMETTQRRNAYREQVLRDYNRTIAEETGINLDTVLDRDGPKRTTEVKDDGSVSVENERIEGSLRKELQRGVHSGDFSEITSSDIRMARALGFYKDDGNGTMIPDVDRWNLYDSGTKDFYRRWLRSEVNHQGLYDTVQAFGPDNKTLLEIEMGKTLSPIVNKKIFSAGRFRNSTYKTNIINQDKVQHSLNAQLSTNIYSGSLNRDATRIATERGKDPAKARARMKKANKAYEVGNNLFFSATTKEVLQQVEQGSFIRAFFINSRGFGLFPYIDKRIGASGEFTQYADVARDVLEGKFHKLPQATTVAAFMGLALEVDNYDKLSWVGKKMADKGWLDSHAWVEWDKKNIIGGDTITSWTQARVNVGKAQGIFSSSEWGVYDTIKGGWGETGKVFHDIGFSNPENFDPITLFSDPDKLDGFLDNLDKAIYHRDQLLSGKALPKLTKLDKDFIKLIEAIGLDDPEAQRLFKNSVALFRDPIKGGKKWLFETLDKTGAFPLDPAKRWAFLQRIDKSGKIAAFTNRFAGGLNTLTRELNAIRTFFYKQVLFGGYAGSSSLIKLLVNNPITRISRAFLNKLGFAGDIGLSERIAQFGFVQRATSAGKFFSKVGAGNATFGAGSKVARIFGNRILTKVIMSNMGKLALRTVGYILSGLSGILTGGLSWVIMAFSDVIWKFTKNILKLDLKAAIQESAEALKAKLVVVKKILVYPIIAVIGCVTAPFLLLGAIIMVIISPGMMAPIEPMSGGLSAQIASEKIDVTKTSNVDQSTGVISYLIRVDNQTASPVTIASWEDNLVYSSCETQGLPGSPGTSVKYGETGFIGEILPPETLNPGGMIGYEIPANGNIMYDFRLQNIETTEDGTYSNSIEVEVEGESGRSATSSVSDNIGNGNQCALCPEGWPVDEGWISQGPHVDPSTWADTTHLGRGAESIDIAALDGIPGKSIKATHSGTVVVGWDSSGYGHWVKVTSDLGFTSLYAHMEVKIVTNGQRVNAGEELGRMGGSGTVDNAIHVHYEFKHPWGECDGQQIKMDEPFIPINVDPWNPLAPRIKGCVGIDGCHNTRI